MNHSRPGVGVYSLLLNRFFLSQTKFNSLLYDVDLVLPYMSSIFITVGHMCSGYAAILNFKSVILRNSKETFVKTIRIYGF